MLTRNWYSDGWDAYIAGQPKMLRSDTGAADFNAGWADAEQNMTDVEALAEVLHDLGVVIWQ